MQAIPTVIETENAYEDEDDVTKNTSHYVTDSEEEKEDEDKETESEHQPTIAETQD
jgi:hypothetical protein